MSEGSPQLSSLTPSLLPSLLSPQSIPGSLEPPWGLRKPQFASLASSLPPHSQNIPGSLEPSWGLRNPPACFPCFPCSQIAPLALRASLGLWNLPGTSGSPSLLLLLPEHSYIPRTFLGSQEALSLLPLLPACSPCSQSIPGSLEPFWTSGSLQLAPLTPRASLDPLNLPKASGSPPLASLATSLLPLLPACFPCSQSIPGSLKPSWASGSPQLAPLAPKAFLHPWNLPGASGSSQLAPLATNSLPLLPAHSPCFQSIPGSLEPSWGLRKPQLTPLAARASLGPWILPVA